MNLLKILDIELVIIEVVLATLLDACISKERTARGVNLVLFFRQLSRRTKSKLSRHSKDNLHLNFGRSIATTVDYRISIWSPSKSIFVSRNSVDSVTTSKFTEQNVQNNILPGLVIPTITALFIPLVLRQTLIRSLARTTRQVVSPFSEHCPALNIGGVTCKDITDNTNKPYRRCLLHPSCQCSIELILRNSHHEKQAEMNTPYKYCQQTY